jgi:hypothetical protein
VNFSYKGVNYGLEMLYLTDQNSQPINEVNQIDFSIVLNRVFLEIYKEPSQFWSDIIKVYESYEQLIYK